MDSFQFVSTYGYQALLVAVREDSPIKTMADLIAAAKANPGKLTYSSVGVGSTQHLAGELLCAMAGIEMTHVPYRGGSGPMTDLLGGTIDLNVDTITVIEPQLRAGKVTVLGVTSGEKWWSLPDITPISATVPGYDVKTWVGLAGAEGDADRHREDDQRRRQGRSRRPGDRRAAEQDRPRRAHQHARRDADDGRRADRQVEEGRRRRAYSAAVTTAKYQPPRLDRVGDRDRATRHLGVHALDHAAVDLRHALVPGFPAVRTRR